MVSVEMLEDRARAHDRGLGRQLELIAACAARTGLPTLISGASSRRNCSSTTGLAHGMAIFRSRRSTRRFWFVLAILYGYDAIILSNEQSAIRRDARIRRQQVNHQWSKSLEFEQRLRVRTQRRTLPPI